MLVWQYHIPLILVQIIDPLSGAVQSAPLLPFIVAELEKAIVVLVSAKRITTVFLFSTATPSRLVIVVAPVLAVLNVLPMPTFGVASASANASTNAGRFPVALK
jgi:hypothetical protein